MVQTPEKATTGTELTLPVLGMTCASCVNRIERYLKRADGVAAAHVNLATERATVQFDPAVIDRAGIAAAIHAEHGYKHTAMMHSLNIRNLTKMAQAVDTTLFIKNGPCMTGLGLGGEGFLSFSVATPTGEGVTTPMTFTRSRRCVMVEELNLF